MAVANWEVDQASEYCGDDFNGRKSSQPLTLH